MSNYNQKIQTLLNEKADLEVRKRLIPFDGSIEVKTIGDEQYIYVRKRELGKNTSKYLDKYSQSLYEMLYKQALELREIKKNIRRIEKQLAILGFKEIELSPKVILNSDFARINVKSLIYDQAVLEGVATTFPQTEAIIENGIVQGVTASDVQKILNLKHAWEFILYKDVLMSPSNFFLLSYVARLVNEGFFKNGGRVRAVPVVIGGTSFVPSLPNEINIKHDIDKMLNQESDDIDIAIDLCLYAMRTQIFNDGNKRSAIIFANHYLISKGQGLLVVPQELVSQFKQLLINYYEGVNTNDIKVFLKNHCWRKM